MVTEQGVVSIDPGLLTVEVKESERQKQQTSYSGYHHLHHPSWRQRRTQQVYKTIFLKGRKTLINPSMQQISREIFLKGRKTLINQSMQLISREIFCAMLNNISCNVPNL
jgi:hypothetical protein